MDTIKVTSIVLWRQPLERLSPLDYYYVQALSLYEWTKNGHTNSVMKISQLQKDDKGVSQALWAYG